MHAGNGGGGDKLGEGRDVKREGGGENAGWGCNNIHNHYSSTMHVQSREFTKVTSTALTTSHGQTTSLQ